MTRRIPNWVAGRERKKRLASERVDPANAGGGADVAPARGVRPAIVFGWRWKLKGRIDVEVTGTQELAIEGAIPLD